MEEEAELLLQCEVQANPPVSVSWEQDGAPLNPLEGGFIVTNDGYSSRLSVGRVERGVHQGVYGCVTTSPVYGTSSKSFQVTVTGQCTAKLRDYNLLRGIASSPSAKS